MSAEKLAEALRNYERVRESLFGHCLSNGVFNAWGGAFDCTSLNDVHLEAKAALAAFEAQAQAEAEAKPAEPAGFVLVPAEPTEKMMRAAVVYANGNAVYKNVAAEALAIEESIYGEVWAAMLAAAPAAPAEPWALSKAAQSVIGAWLAKAMDEAVENGANSISMPDEFVEIAAMLAAAPAAPAPLTDEQIDDCMRAVGLYSVACAVPQNRALLRGFARATISASKP